MIEEKENSLLSDSEIDFENSDLDSEDESLNNSSSGQIPSSTKKKNFKNAKYCAYTKRNGEKCTTRIMKKNIKNDYCASHMKIVVKNIKKDNEIDERLSSLSVYNPLEKQLNEWGIDIPLYLHQQLSVNRMKHIEENNIQTFNETFKQRSFIEDFENSSLNVNVTLQSKVHILSDKVGSGKTLTTVSFLSSVKNDDEIKFKPSYDSSLERFDFPSVNISDLTFNSSFSDYFRYHSTYNKHINVIDTNIIVCAASVYNQWINELSHSNLKYKVIFKSIDLQNINQWYVNKYDVILVTYNRYNDFVDLFQNCVYNNELKSKLFKDRQPNQRDYYFESKFKEYVREKFVVKRLIFDELQTSGRLYNLNAHRYWIISGSLSHSTSLYFNYNDRDKRTNMICNILDKIQNKHINIGNNEDIIRQSYQQAETIQHVYECYIRDLNVLSHYLPNEAKRMIAAGDMSSAISYLGGQRDNKKLSDIIIEKEEYNIRQLEASLIYYTQLENKTKVEEVSQKIENTKRSLENLKNKIQEIENQECPVCYDDFDGDKILTSCCKFILCSNCIKSLILSSNKCPFCRAQIELSSLIVSTDKSLPESEEKKQPHTRKSKLETVIDIIKAKPDGKFLLFSEYWHTFNSIATSLTDNNISWAEIKGTTDSKQKNIKLYKEGKTKVLFLNARHDGTGINLPETTDIILYHKVSSNELETQIFGRALRLGRTHQLHVHRLLAEGETHIENSSSSRLNLRNHSDEELEVSLNANNDEDLDDIELDLELDDIELDNTELHPTLSELRSSEPSLMAIGGNPNQTDQILEENSTERIDIEAGGPESDSDIEIEGSSHLNREIESNRDIFKIPYNNPEMFGDILYNLDSSYFNSAKDKYDYALRTYNNFMNPH